MQSCRKLLCLEKTSNKGFYSSSVHQDVLSELNRWNSKLPINSAHTPPNTWYTSEGLLKLEKERVFKNNWLWVGDKEDTINPQSFISGNYLGEPYLVSRDNNNQLNAMYNVCRHHGATLKEV